MKSFHRPPLHIFFLLLLTHAAHCLAMDYRFFVAGGGAAAFSHGITTPVDVIKTKMQANPSQFQDDGLLSAAIKILKDEGEDGGPRAFLGGLGPTVLGYGLEGAAKFGCYELLKPILLQFIPDQPTAFIAASLLAGALAAFLLCPPESARIKIVTDPSYANLGFLPALTKIIQHDGGIQAVLAGFPAMLTKQIPYTIAKQCSFDLFAALFYPVLTSTENLKFLVPVLAAAAASVLACLASQPGDMILTETYAAAAAAESGGASSNIGGVVSKLWGEGKIPRFFVGTNARLVHVGVIITSQLVVYDLLKQWLGLPATGAH